MSQPDRENTEITTLHEEKVPLYKGQDLAVGLAIYWVERLTGPSPFVRQSATSSSVET